MYRTLAKNTPARPLFAGGVEASSFNTTAGTSSKTDAKARNAEAQAAFDDAANEQLNNSIKKSARDLIKSAQA